MHIVILSGGVGSRLWPVSRKNHPKPLLNLDVIGGNCTSLLQETFLRALDLVPSSIINVTNKELLLKIQQHWNELPHKFKNHINPTYILEPLSKNTAAAIAMSCLLVAKEYGDDELVLILPSDHFIAKEKIFYKAVEEAKIIARKGKIVTLGIKPESPETEYGYIEFCQHSGNVKSFCEKPSIGRAQNYLSSGDYLWNSGILCFKAGVMMREILQHASDIIASVTESFDKSHFIHNMLDIDSASFAKVKAESIDVAILEKSQSLAVIPCDMGWRDVGNWNAVSECSYKDLNNNVIKAESVISDVKNSYIKGSHRLIAVSGVRDLIIVDTEDALLITGKDKAKNVKDIYKILEEHSHKTHKENSSAVLRSWGCYTILDNNSFFKIKRLEINPLSSLSLQSHQHRSEHWIVVSGNALIINDDREMMVSANQYIYVCAGNKHKLSNPSNSKKLIVIEIQTGSYLGEDDIERFDV